MNEAIEDVLGKEDALSILDHLSLPNEGGTSAGVRFGFGIELYMSHAERQRTRSAIVDVVADYQSRLPDKLNRFLADGSRRMRKASGRLADLVAKDMEKLSLAEGYGMLLVGNEASIKPNDAVAQYGIGALVQRTDDIRNSFLQIYSPIAAMHEPAGNGYAPLLEALLRWCNYCQPIHGSAGVAVLLEFSSIYQTSALAYPLLKRFPGFEYTDPGTFAFEARGQVDRIKCVNWLTVLNDDLVDVLGGIDPMRASIEPTCRIHRYPGGVVIQAGELPQLGDANRQEKPTAYRVAAAFTKKLRFEEYRSQLFRVPMSLDPVEETLKWVRRFD